MFGSDTHAKDWDNSVRFFDVSALQWSQAYAEDDPATYRTNGQGLPVAGNGVERPWAMHAFDAVEYDPVNDRLIVASYPRHMSPDKPWGMDRELWQRIDRHPTWIFHLADKRWEPLQAEAVHFFPYAATFDRKRNRTVGTSPDGFFSLGGQPAAWEKIATSAPDAWHTSSAYDGDTDTIVVYGSHRKSNEVWQLDLTEGKAKRMPTPGQRPPGGESVPMVFHPGIGRIVALVHNPLRNVTETWLYETKADRWSRQASAEIPFDIGINYTLVYDPAHSLLWLLANTQGEPLAAWALRFSI